MIGIIKTILCESKFVVGESFAVESNQLINEVQSFKSSQNQSQVFLLLPILESKLLEMDFLGILPDIATAFKSTKQYEPEMEKNTSLVVCVNRDVDSIKLSKEAITIEDDPYYFKKYLFSYHDNDAKKFEQLKKEYVCEHTVEFIQKYVINSNNFELFKDNSANAESYKMISDLLVKLPIISIGFNSTEKILTVEDFFLKEESYKQKNKLDQILDIVNISNQMSGEQLADQIIKIWDGDSEEVE